MQICPNCSYQAVSEFNFCPMCGYYFKGEKDQNLNAGSQREADAAVSVEDKKTQTQKHYKVANGLYEYPKAPLGKRLGAYLIDGVIMFVLSIPFIALVTIGFMMNPGPEEFDEESLSGPGIVGGVFTLWGLFSLIFPAIYYFIKDGLKNGQSYGKRFLGLMVVDTQKNQPCKIGKSAFRSLISSLIVAIPFINVLTVWIEPIMVIARDDGRKAADLVASTQVIDAALFEKQ